MTRKVTRGNREIVLTTKEFQLLEYLVRNKNRVLSRVLIIEHIWDMQFDSGTNIVDVVVNRLRRKIDDGSAVPLIHTVRGVGYVAKEPESAHSRLSCAPCAPFMTLWYSVVLLAAFLLFGVSVYSYLKYEGELAIEEGLTDRGRLAGRPSGGWTAS